MKRLFAFLKKEAKEICSPIIIGKNNKILFKDNNDEIEINNRNYKNYLIGIELEIIGNNNRIIIDRSTIFDNSSIKIDNSNNGTLIIENNSDLNNLHIIAHLADNFNINFGRDNRITGGLSIMCVEHNTGFISGSECLYANEIKARCGDAHTIIDKKTREILNKPTRCITIGDHCWIGDNVLLTKKTHLPDNTIVAMGSVVTKQFSEQNTIIGGNPAKIIKKNIDWHKFRISNYIKDIQ